MRMTGIVRTTDGKVIEYGYTRVSGYFVIPMNPNGLIEFDYMVRHLTVHDAVRELEKFAPVALPGYTMFAALMGISIGELPME